MLYRLTEVFYLAVLLFRKAHVQVCISITSTYTHMLPHVHVHTHTHIQAALLHVNTYIHTLLHVCVTTHMTSLYIQKNGLITVTHTIMMSAYCTWIYTNTHTN